MAANLERVEEKWEPVFRQQPAQAFVWRASFTDQAIPPDPIVL